MATYDMKCETGRFADIAAERLPDLLEHDFDGIMVKVHDIEGGEARIQISLRAGGKQRMISYNTCTLRAGDFMDVPLLLEFNAVN